MKNKINNSSTKKFKNNYKWYKDSKFLGTFLLLFVILMQIFAWIQIPFFTTIHAYTVGMLVGYFNPLIYGALIFLALKNIFEIKIEIKWWKYIFFSVSIIFVSTSTFFYQQEKGFLIIGSTPWKVSFGKWFASFSENTTWVFPNPTNGGVLGAFLFSFFGMISSGIGVIIISIFSLILSLYFIIKIFIFVIYKRNKTIIKKEQERKNKIIENKIINKERTIQRKENIDDIKNIEIKNNIIEEKNNYNEDPFEDPFL